MLELKSTMRLLSSWGMSSFGRRSEAGGYTPHDGLLAGFYISRVDGRLLSAHEGMDTAENEVGLLVFTSPLPPSFDHAFVVAVYFEVDATTAG